MAKFVWIDVKGGGRVPINPDAVQYLRRNAGGETCIMFGAFAGGMDELVTTQTAEEIVQLLEDRTGGLEPPGVAQKAARRRAPKGERPKPQRLVL